jgi:hypothetical protein
MVGRISQRDTMARHRSMSQSQRRPTRSKTTPSGNPWKVVRMNKVTMAKTTKTMEREERWKEASMSMTMVTATIPRPRVDGVDEEADDAGRRDRKRYC